MKNIASKAASSTAQACVGYELSKGVAVITKAEHEESMKENSSSIDMVSKLTNGDLKVIDLLN